MEERRNYVGAELGFNLKTDDVKINPKNGAAISLSAKLLNNLDNDEQVEQYAASVSGYITFGAKLPVTFAFRTGYMHANGDVQFYQYPSIGNNLGLRGFRNERFRGDHVFYQNVDLRAELVNWNNNVLPMDIGILGGFDIGKVWLNSAEEQGKFNRGYTVGAWFNIFSLLVLQPYYSFSEEAELINFRFGFNF